ncbi:hypothetical protein [Streptomyces sp. NPDC088707]
MNFPLGNNAIVQTSQQLHADLVGWGPGPLAALLVEVTHPRVQAPYETWG